MPTSPRLIFLLNSAQRRLQQWAAEEQARATQRRQPGTKAAAPSAAQGGALFVLAEHDGLTMGELSHALELVPSAASGLVQRMETQGWLQRQPCDLDARTQRVWLQPAGREQLPALRRAVSRINDQLTAGFSEAELQTVARWLQHVQQLGKPAIDSPDDTP